MKKLPQIAASNISIDEILCKFYEVEDFKIRVLYLHPESGLYGTSLIENIDNFINEIKEIFEWGFSVDFQIER